MNSPIIRSSRTELENIRTGRRQLGKRSQLTLVLLRRVGAPPSEQSLQDLWRSGMSDAANLSYSPFAAITRITGFSLFSSVLGLQSGEYRVVLL